MKVTKPEIFDELIDPTDSCDDELLTPCMVRHKFTITTDAFLKMRRKGEGPDYVQLPWERGVRYSVGTGLVPY